MVRISSAARVLALGAALALLTAGAGGGARAQDATKPAAAATPAAPGVPGVPVIIVIDPDRVVRESAAGKSVSVEAEKYAKDFEEENRKEEATLQASAQDLQKEQATLPRDQLDQKRGELEQRAAEVRRDELKRRQAFDRSFNASMDQVQQAMIEATREVAASHKADVVLVRQAVMFFNNEYDITGPVIDLMNKRLTKVEFPPPKIEPDQPAPAGAAAPAPGQPVASDPSKTKPKPKPTAGPQPLNLQLQQQQ